MVETQDSVHSGMADGNYRSGHDVFGGRQKGPSHHLGDLIVQFANILERLIWIPVAIILIAAAAFAVMLMDNDPPVTFIEGSESMVIESDRVVLSYRIIRHRFCDSTITRMIIDPAGRIEHMTTMAYTAEQLRERQAMYGSQLRLVLPRPANPMPGIYRMRATELFSCNFAQELWPLRGSFSVPYRQIGRAHV